jgi:hypothetical protein
MSSWWWGSIRTQLMDCKGALAVLLDTFKRIGIFNRHQLTGEEFHRHQLLQSRIVELSKQVDQISTDFSKLRSDIESRVERESRET